MASAIATRPGPPLVRHVHIQVDLPPGSTEEEQDALVLAALVREVEKRGGIEALSRREQPAPLRPAQPSMYAPPSPRPCRTVLHLLDRMRDLKEWAELSFADLEERARQRGFPPLPHSTIARLLNDDRMPTHAQLTSFVMVCGLSEDQWREWAAAWEKVQPNAALRGRPWVLPGGKAGPNRVVGLGGKRRNANIERLVDQVTHLKNKGISTERIAEMVPSAALALIR